MHQHTILAVDDDPDILELLCLSLRTTGSRVIGAPDGPTALAELERTHVDLLVLDVMMPLMSGLEVARRVRASTAGRSGSPKILMVTALGSVRDVEAATAAGADDYLRKPFAVRDLVDRAVTLLATLDRVPPRLLG